MYSKRRNTYFAEPKKNPKDRIQIEVGDSKQDDFKPQMKLMRWDNEVNFSIRAEEHPEGVLRKEGKKIKYISPDYEVHQFDKPDIAEDGGFEFEWVLNKRPRTNVLKTTIQTKGLDFYKQNQLTQADISRGENQPENVKGSYAVYHSTRGKINRIDGMDYKAGKAFHIYRPKIIDFKGNKTWGELNISKSAGILTVTIDEAWLTKAVYPVVVDPTFGLTSIGGNNGAHGGNSVRVVETITMPENGDVEKLTSKDRYCNLLMM